MYCCVVSCHRDVFIPVLKCVLYKIEPCIKWDWVACEEHRVLKYVDSSLQVTRYRRIFVT